MQTNLMQCAVYGLSTDRLTSLPLQPLQQCWQHSYVLSGTCPVKPLYGLGHRTPAQFQGLGNLIIAVVGKVHRSST